MWYIVFHGKIKNNAFLISNKLFHLWQIGFFFSWYHLWFCRMRSGQEWNWEVFVWGLHWCKSKLYLMGHACFSLVLFKKVLKLRLQNDFPLETLLPSPKIPRFCITTVRFFISFPLNLLMNHKLYVSWTFQIVFWRLMNRNWDNWKIFITLFNSFGKNWEI